MNIPDHNNNFNLIRLLAAIQVVLVHGLNHFGIEGMLLEALKAVPGVPVFFFVSGLLIYSSYDRMKVRGLRAFFVNRALRIYPALWVNLALSLFAVIAIGYLGTQQFLISHFVLWLVGQGTIIQFYNPDYFRALGVGVLNGALWTISVELQFYLLTPFLFWLLVSHRTLLIVLMAFSVIVNIYCRYFLDWTRIEMKLVYVSFIPWVYMFLLGFFAMHHRELTERLKNRIRLRYLIAAYLVSMIVIGSYKTNASNAINPISLVLLAGCILKLSTASVPLPRRFLQFIARADFSYGLYLYHMPFINILIFLGLFAPLLNLVVVCAATAFAAILSWYLVERPALLHKR